VKVRVAKLGIAKLGIALGLPTLGLPWDCPNNPQLVTYNHIRIAPHSSFFCQLSFFQTVLVGLVKFLVKDDQFFRVQSKNLVRLCKYVVAKYFSAQNPQLCFWPNIFSPKSQICFGHLTL